MSGAAHPLANALVIALNLEDFNATQTYTAHDGSFVMPTLRTGIYKIIAVKQGFVPAIATVLPTRADHKVTLRLDSDKKSARKSANQEIWELRGSLPPDVLRELDFAMAEPEVAATTDENIPRFRAEMLSLTGVANQTASPAFAQTAVGVSTRLGDSSWQVGARANMQRFEDPTDSVRFGPPIAESAVMSVELRKDTESYRVASTQSSWLYADPSDERQADVRAHNFEWQSGAGSRVQVRYFEQDNLFRETADESNLIEIASDVPIVSTRRNEFGVTFRVAQESVGTSEDRFRVADVSANGTLALVPSLIVHYGMASRIGMQGQEWAPRTGAEWKLTENTSVIGSAMVKVLDRDTTTLLIPSIVFWSEDGRILPKYAYTVGFVSGKDESNRFSAVATVTAVDAPVRMVFTDAENQFWDGLEVDAGDVRRDVRVAYRKAFGKRFAIDVATTAGSAASSDPNALAREKVYVTGDLQSTFNPTRTTIAVSYRDIQQPRGEGEEDYRSERIHVRMAQSLYLPIDIKLLLGLELARAENSPYLIDTLTPEGRSKKYIGGLALNF
ncbi:MAG TPA: carboxypeptidase-like regulatory domain-containing protein [Thermoanaerobaculia bacterium]